MIKNAKRRKRLLNGVGVAIIILLMIVIPKISKNEKNNDMVNNVTDAQQKESDIDIHQNPTPSVELSDLESQSNEEVATSEEAEIPSEVAEVPAENTEVVTEEQAPAPTDIASNTPSTNVDTTATGSSNEVNSGDTSNNSNTDIASADTGSDWDRKIETIDRGDVSLENGGAYIVHEGDQARHDVGDSTSVRDYYNVLVDMGYSEEEALAQLRDEGYNV